MGFRFKEFSVNQNHAAMKVGTDGVLLGAWAPVDKCSRILDVGTGTGLIALMMAQRQPKATIVAIDIDEGAILQAKENICMSPWGNRINLNHSSFQVFAAENTIPFDLVVCNPPFFTNSLKSPISERSIARHNDTMPLYEFAECVGKVLCRNGLCAVVLPLEQFNELKICFSNLGFGIAQQINVYPTPHKAIKRVLGVFGRNLVDEPSVTSLIIESNGRHQYSEEYKLLTRDFYLNF